MRSLAMLLVALASCTAPARQPIDAVVTFAIAGGDDATNTALATVGLAAQKSGREPIVDAWQDELGEGEQYGRHKFPRGCTAAAIAGYYQGLLGNAGWTAADFRVDGPTIQLFGVEDVACTADRTEITVAVARLPR